MHRDPNLRKIIRYLNSSLKYQYKTESEVWFGATSTVAAHVATAVLCYRPCGLSSNAVIASTQA